MKAVQMVNVKTVLAKAAHVVAVIVKHSLASIQEESLFNIMRTHQVWSKYSEDLKRFIISKVKDVTVADDILQDTFLKIHTKLHTLKNITKLKPWIFTIARNSVMDYFKSSNKIFEIGNFELEAKQEDENVQHTEKECLQGILRNLPKKYRDPLFLSDIKGMKQAQVAKQLYLSLPTVKSQIQRARKLIAQGFIDCCGFKLNDKGQLVGEVKDKEDCKVCN